MANQKNNSGEYFSPFNVSILSENAIKIGDKISVDPKTSEVTIDAKQFGPHGDYWFQKLR